MFITTLFIVLPKMEATNGQSIGEYKQCMFIQMNIIPLVHEVNYQTTNTQME